MNIVFNTSLEYYSLIITHAFDKRAVLTEAVLTEAV